MKILFALLLSCSCCFGQVVLRNATVSKATLGQTNSAGGGGGGDDLTNRTLEWDADDVSQTDSTAVAVAVDHLGNGHDLIGGWDGSGVGAQGSGMPIIKNAVVNGHNAFQFDGTDDRFGTNLSCSLYGTTTDNTVVIVMKQDSSQAQNCVISYNFGEMALYATYNDLLLYDYPYNGGSGRNSQGQPTGWDNAWHVVICRRSSGTSQIWVDGVSLGTASVSGTFTTSGTADIVVGSFNYGAGSNFKGQITLFRNYNVAKDDTAIGNIYTFQKTKYGTP